MKFSLGVILGRRFSLWPAALAMPIRDRAEAGDEP